MLGRLCAVVVPLALVLAVLIGREYLVGMRAPAAPAEAAAKGSVPRAPHPRPPERLHIPATHSRTKPEPARAEARTQGEAVRRPQRYAARPVKHAAVRRAHPHPLVSEASLPAPKPREVARAAGVRRFGLAPGAVMSLTIRAVGLYGVPVFGSASQQALDDGVIHIPGTSLPWSHTPQRNVYLAGHRLGYPGTGSRLIFYNLNQLRRGAEVVLKDRRGRAYRYRVSQIFVVYPTDTWVMGQVRGRDMVTLQTCTPIPTFDRRLIVRADRI